MSDRASGALRAGLDRLAELLARERPCLETLARLGPPRHLALLLHLALIEALRGGPGREPAPGPILQLAGRAAAAGLLGLADLESLGRGLGDLKRELVRGGFWDSGEAVAPFWWAPLPPPSPLEELWGELKARGENDKLPARAALARTLGESGPGWLGLRGLLPADLVAAAHRELRAAHEGEGLDLAREGVGATGQLSSARSDSVLYLSGREPELLAAAPRAAALVQWCLGRLGPHLGRTLPGGPAFPPQRAMLARYPGASAGYSAHFDNPGGERDNGRAFTLVLYLNDPGKPCRGGEIALWEPGRPSDEPPDALLPAVGGSAALFDARRVAHRVLPVGKGPARWALTLWLNSVPQAPPAGRLPRPTPRDALLPIAEPPLPPGRLLFHELGGGDPAGELVPRRVPDRRPRIGLVSTVYRAGAFLETFCRHHLAGGVDHLLLVFDHLEEPAEATAAEALRERYGEAELTLWDGRETRHRWHSLPATARQEELLRLAPGGGSSWAVSARQTLNASLALEAARGDELGGSPLGWLLHLDADELLHPEGPGRGGADLSEHFAAAEAADLVLLRYLNHELLQAPEGRGASPVFKRNPRLAAARLGPAGWQALSRHLRMGQTDPRPYFLAYHNGKSAVRVAAARAAAGVHGFHLSDGHEGRRRLLAGPSVLHFHGLDPESFRRKYLAKAAAPEPDAPLFEPSPVETAARGLIRDLEARRAGPEELAAELDLLFHRLTRFEDEELDLLAEAGLLFTPNLG